MSERAPLSANVLKIIAVISMFIDHFTVVLFSYFYLIESNETNSFGVTDELLNYYQIGRAIGRLAFPLFAFFVAEGMFYTKDRRRYLERVFLFALISEIPFDLALFGTPFYYGASDVLFTLFLGGVGIYLGDIVLGKKVKTSENGRKVLSFDEDSNAKNMPLVLRIIIVILIYAGAMYLGKYFLTDYSYAGVAVVLLDYFFMYELDFSGNSVLTKRLMGFSAGLLVLILFSSRTEVYALFDVILLFLYNGKRGKQSKYFFYLFYPAHLFLLSICFKILT